MESEKFRSMYDSGLAPGSRSSTVLEPFTRGCFERAYRKLSVVGQKMTFADVRGVGGAFFIVKGVTQR